MLRAEQKLSPLPAKVRVFVQPEVGETERYWLGPIFAVWIGAWSLPTLIIGIVESSVSKKAVWRFSPILLLANIVLALYMGCNQVLERHAQMAIILQLTSSSLCNRRRNYASLFRKEGKTYRGSKKS